MATGTTSKTTSSKNTCTLSWEGKPDRESLQRYSGKLDTVIPLANEQTGTLIWSENTLALDYLITHERLSGKVNLIYIDPPYATQKIFHTKKKKVAYEDLLTGDAYLTFLYERLIRLHELLSDHGSIYLHLDQNMIFEAKLLMDEVFGRKNFRNFITRQKCNSKNSTRNQYGNICDHILFYSKSSDYTWNRAYAPWEPEEARRAYSAIEEGTGRRFKKVPVHAPGVRKGATGEDWKGMSPPKGKHWQYTPDKLDELDAKGEIYWSSTGNPRRKLYLDESPGIAVQDLWDDCRDNINQNDKTTGYPTEKNPELLQRIIQASSNPGDLILDAFSGSGVSLDTAGSLGRLWVGIDESKEAMITTTRRLANTGTSFRFLKDMTYSIGDIYNRT